MTSVSMTSYSVGRWDFLSLISVSQVVKLRTVRQSDFCIKVVLHVSCRIIDRLHYHKFLILPPFGLFGPLAALTTIPIDLSLPKIQPL